MDRRTKEKITLGIFGGSFDPPHIGHIKLCEEFSKALSSRVLVMPAKISPFKKEKHHCVTNKDRVEMCKLAFSSIDNVKVSEYEINEEGVSYTYKTVEHFLKINPNEKICLCIGADCLNTLERWYNAEYLFKNCVFAAALRYEDADTAFNESVKNLERKYSANIIPLLYSPIEVSSTDIRMFLKDGKDVSGYISKEVENYIKEKGLYRG